MKINKVLMAVLTACSFASVGQLAANDTVFSNPSFSSKSATDSLFNGSSYKQIGFERLEIEMENEFVAKGVNMFTATYGYRITDNISFEFFGSIPLNSKKEIKYTDTFRNQIGSELVPIDTDGDGVDDANVPMYDENVTSVEYANTVEAKYFAGANVKLDFPIHKAFDLFVTLGYTHGKVTHKGQYLNFVDNAPAEDPQMAFFNGSNDCEITGKEGSAFCGTADTGFNNEYSSSGYTYGAGFRFYYANNTTLNFHWKKMDYTNDLSVESMSANLEWRF
jgi:opacity protein-like surface antigen